MVNLRSLLCGLLMVAVLVLGGCDKRAKDRDQIATVFRDFQLATNNKAGEDAASLLSTEGIDWYDRMLALARDASVSKTRSLSPVEKASVLEIRARLTRKQTDKWTGRDFFVYATKQGWWASKDQAVWTLRRFRYKPGEASAEVVIDDEPTEHRVRFVVEYGVWKYDDTSINDLMNLMLEFAADEEDLPIDDALVKWEAKDSGKELGPEVWGPMK